MQKPKAILFDWDNTLADTWPTIHEALVGTFTMMGQTPWTLEETKRNVHKSLRDAFPSIFGERWQEAKDIYMKNFLSKHIEKLTTLPDAEAVLKHLKDKGIFLAVVSNKTGQHLRKEVAHIGWNIYFSKIIGALDAEEDKPSCAPVKLALQGSGIALGPDVWLIGDSITDIDCALNSGITPLYFGPEPFPQSYLDESEKRQSGLKGMKHLHNHKELLEFLAHL